MLLLLGLNVGKIMSKECFQYFIIVAIFCCVKQMLLCMIDFN